MQTEIIEGYRLSPQQKRLWSLQQPDLTLPYRAQFTILIEGNLNIGFLKTALQQVINRHEILRTNFRLLPGMTIPLQIIKDNYTPLIHFQDLSSFNLQEQQEKIQTILDEVLQLPLNLETDQLLHLSLITLSSQKHLLLVSLPSMLADTVTIQKLVQEISCAYTACLQGEELEDEAVQYADFAEWQNELLESEETEAGKKYWQKQDISVVFNLKFPFENRLSEILDFHAKSFSVEIPANSFKEIKTLAQKHEISISIFLLTCWQVLLWHLMREEKIIVGKVFDGRKYEELETAIGLFAKYLPIPCQLSADSKLAEVLKQVESAVQEADKWQEYFTWEALTVDKHSPKLNFFPFCFEFKDKPESYSSNELLFSVLQQYVCFERFKIKLICIRQASSLKLEFQYDSNLVNTETIERLVNQYQTLLESAVNNPEAAISQLGILNDRDLHQLLVEFNQTQTNYPPAQCIHQLIEKQAQKTPDAVAVVFENRQLTYRELNTQANQLAHYLQKLGVKPEEVVGLLIERSLEIIVGFLGILKAGGAYLPLDPTLPTESIAFRLQDAQVSLVISQQSLVDSKELLTADTRRFICLDIDWETIAEESNENPISEVKPDNLAYIIYTSGSTGKPKGVAVEHRQLYNYLHAIIERLDLTSCKTFATVSTFSADLGNTVIFPALCTGGCLHVVSKERASNPEALADYFRRYPIDCLKIVPSHLKALLSAEYPEYILPQQRLILGGEACTWQLIDQLINYAPKCQIFNHYGPTEATVGVLTYPIKLGETVQYSETVPIGRPLANTHIYLLNSDLQPVPIGVPSELYIGGTGLARGYLNQPELTAEKFLEKQKGKEDDSLPNLGRLYKTGDLARYLPDGNIEFIGRIDHQVKIHGFRIELGEIEAVLAQQSAVREAVVLACEDQLSNKRLVAYVVSQSESKVTTNELREYLQKKLPDYMVPSVFIQLKTLPLTPNGKVDRQALPTPDINRLEWEETFVAPRTTAEEKLAGIWRQVLGLQQVGIHNNFFELGGDSILSMQIIAKANQAGLQLTPKQLFEHQTIAELAAVVGQKVISAEQGLVTGTVPLTPIQHWFFEQNQPKAHHWNQAILLEVQQPLNPAVLKEAVQKLLEHHDALRLCFIPKESGWQQFNANFRHPSSLGQMREGVPFTQLNLSELSESEQKSFIETTATELQASLKLSEAPLVRVALFNLGTSSRLLIVIHHLAVDGVSWRILLEDLQTVYEQLSQGETVQLPPKTTSFKQWAERLQEYAQSAELQQELAYWLSEFHQPIPSLPLDFSRGANTVASAETVSVALSVEETQALLQQVPAAYQTQINEVLLTALMQAFKEWTGETRLLVDLEGHGREDIFEDVDLSRTVGWFTTIFPVQLNFSDVETRNFASPLGEALTTVKHQLRNIPNRGIGYGVLRYLKRDQQLQTLPSAEIRFNYLGQSDQVFSSSLFKPALESSGPSRSLQGNRVYLLDINGIVTEGRLQLNWTYSQNLHRRSTIERLAQGFLDKLRMLIIHCQSIKIEDSSAVEIDLETAALNADAILDSTIYPETPSVKLTAEATQIFLTGATGFLGAFLLDELLQLTQADIYCLVRAANVEEGKQKIQKNLDFYSLWNESFSQRIIPVGGDLSQPFFGLSQEEFQAIASQIDVIYHNAATTNLIYPYSVLKPSNVLGTQEILRLASQVKLKPVHYISTLSVLSSVNNSGTQQVISELDNLDKVKAPYGGYAQTKWVAEKLILTARDRGIPTSIYRLGRVAGHSKTGVCNTNDRLYRMIKGFIQLGCSPTDNTTVDMTPVDYVSKAIIHLSRQNESFNKVFHICNPQPIQANTLLDWIRSFGYAVKPVSNEQWQTELLNQTENSSDNVLFPLMPFFAANGAEPVNQTEFSEPTSNSGLKFDLQNTLNGLAESAIICPPVNDELLKTYFSYLIQSGFLNPPQLITHSVRE